MSIPEALAQQDFQQPGVEIGISGVGIKSHTFEIQTAFFSNASKADWEEALNFLPQDGDPSHRPTHARIIADAGQPILAFIAGVTTGEAPESYISVFPVNPEENNTYTLIAGHPARIDQTGTPIVGAQEILISKQNGYFFVEVPLAQK